MLFRSVTGAAFEHWLPAATEDIIAFRVEDGPVTPVVPVGSPSRFAVSTDAASLYVGDRGRIYHVALPSATSNPVAFSARATLTVRQRATPVRAVASATVPLRSLRFPRISPDGGTVVFGAAGVLWRQALASDTPAQRLTQHDVLESSPAFCPVGHALA